MIGLKKTRLKTQKKVKSSGRDKTKVSNMVSQNLRKRKQGEGYIIKDIMAETYPKFVKYTNPQTYEANEF